jgi:HSP20 family protein
MRGLTRWTDPATWDPFGELAAVAEAFDRAFAELGFPASAGGERGLIETGIAPDFRLAAEDDGYRIAIDLPGIPKESLEVEVQGNTIAVRGEWPEPAVGENATIWRRERPRGRFVRALSVGEPIDAGSVSAKLEDGVLRLQLKKARDAKSRTIEVKS